MPTSKRATQKKQAASSAAPVATRPYIPDPAYGIPKNDKGLLSWSHVTDRMTTAPNYWVCTVSAAGQPHATPVDGVWLDDALYFGGSPVTRTSRNLAENPKVSVHIGDGFDVVILEGVVRQERVDKEKSVRLSQASIQKYGYGSTPEEYAAIKVQVFRPAVVFAWKQFPGDVTRWRLEDEGVKR
jgi:hypothetical protein